jgi:hypothetical protein
VVAGLLWFMGGVAVVNLESEIEQERTFVSGAAKCLGVDVEEGSGDASAVVQRPPHGSWSETQDGCDSLSGRSANVVVYHVSDVGFYAHCTLEIAQVWIVSGGIQQVNDFRYVLQ